MTDGRQKWKRYIEHYANIRGDGTYTYTEEQIDFLFDARENNVSWNNIVKIWHDDLGWPSRSKSALTAKYHRVKTFG